MNIRTAREEDAEPIALLHAESWRVAYRGMLSDEFLKSEIIADRLNVWRQRLGEPKEDQHTLVALDDEELVGFACAFGREDETWGTLLDNLHVRTERKRQGIGQRLMKEVARWTGRRYPGSGLFLWVLEANHPARRFYEKLGAKAYGQGIWGAPGGGALTKLRYGWLDVEPLFENPKGSGLR
jgi:GNAT superfamily N-acetyltransferase